MLDITRSIKKMLEINSLTCYFFNHPLKSIKNHKILCSSCSLFNKSCSKHFYFLIIFFGLHGP